MLVVPDFIGCQSPSSLLCLSQWSFIHQLVFSGASKICNQIKENPDKSHVISECNQDVLNSTITKVSLLNDFIICASYKSVSVWQKDQTRVRKIAMITPFDKLIYHNKLQIINIRAFEEQNENQEKDQVRTINIFCSTQVSKVFAFRLMI